jgi:TRAP transporter 4TM/12TM fusion protein
MQMPQLLLPPNVEVPTMHPESDTTLSDPTLGNLSQDTLAKIAAYVEEEEGVTHRFTGVWAIAATVLLVAMSLFHLYAAVGIVPTQTLRPLHVGFMLVAAFALFPMLPRWRGRMRWPDVILLIAAVSVIAYPILGGDDFNDRNTSPSKLDLIAGTVFLLLILEAARRTTGWIMPALTILFLAYAAFGPYLPSPWTHRGYDLVRIVGHMYMTLEGVFGSAVDVAATLIILFTIYGAILQVSGAGRYFLDLSFALTGGKRSGIGRTVVLSSFLLGGPSGSGVATTVTMGTVAWPMMKKAGYDPAKGAGLLAAGGLGAILSPPVLGAAAFLIAEFLKISYMQVITMAVIPTLLYYGALFLMVELDARGLKQIALPERVPTRKLLAKSFHLVSLVAIVAFMLIGFSPTLAVVYTMGLAVAVSWLDPDNRMGPQKITQALSDGALQMINVAATCAVAGIIVGVVTLTGLGLKFSSIVIDLAGGNLLLTALYSSLIVWIVGLAVPVTASYIVCAVIIAPAMIKLGVPDYAAHMFIFYYAVLSEVSPPTALSPFAAAAITGADPMKATLRSWGYTLPAFVVPLAFVVEPAGVGLLMQGGWGNILLMGVTAFLGLAALAVAVQGRLVLIAPAVERALFAVGGIALIYPAAVPKLAGVSLVTVAFGIHALRWRSAQSTLTQTNRSL